MRLTVTSIPVPAPGQPPTRDVLDLVEVERAHHLMIYGHDDLVHDARAVMAGLSRQERTARLRLLVRDEHGRAVGSAHVTMPMTDNEHLGFFFPNWVPGSGVAEADVYDAAWSAADEVLRAEGRTSVQSWAMHPASEEGDGVVPLTPRTGSGQVAEDDRARWFIARGFVLEQVELYSVLDLDQTGHRTEVTPAPAPAHSPYRIRSWVGATPPELLGGMARLRNRMSVDTPTGGIDYREEQWDEAGVAADDERAAAVGLVRVTTVALGEDGSPVAYTVLHHGPQRPESADQDDTLVDGDHRGHGLGLRVKVANLRALREEVPTVRRVHTWNAAENTHMLAINEAMGFTVVGSQGGWQVRRQL